MIDTPTPAEGNGPGPARLNRRALVRAAGAAVAGLAIGATADGGSTTEERSLLAPPCGLYCGSCDDFVHEICHGCGCRCGHCNGNAQASGCVIRQCADRRGVEHCGLCAELPCTALIAFCHDPIWFSHGVAIENLRRRARIGTAAWLAEQADYWSDPDRMRRMLFLLAECKERAGRAGW